jgi:uncharacterized protein (TIGR03382 family)
LRKFILASLAAVCGIAHATTITFDDIPLGTAPYGQVVDGYAGLGWTNLWAKDATAPGQAMSGYVNGTVSAKNVVYNSYANPAGVHSLSSTGFDLHDGYFTAAWNDGLQVTASAVFENGRTATKTFMVDTSGPTDELFGWKDLSSVTFSSIGGTHHAGFEGQGSHFALDNLTISPSSVPEPAPAMLALAGLALLGLQRRRANRA